MSLLILAGNSPTSITLGSGGLVLVIAVALVLFGGGGGPKNPGNRGR